jgi:hypothetical protein
MSDIDLLPIYAASADAAATVEYRRAELVEWRAASVRARPSTLASVHYL